MVESDESIKGDDVMTTIKERFIEFFDPTWKVVHRGTLIAEYGSLLFNRNWEERYALIVEKNGLGCLRAYSIDIYGKKKERNVDYLISIGAYREADR